MIKSKLRTLTTALGGAIGGVGLHHFGSKILSYRDDLNEEIALQLIGSERDKVLFNMQNKVDNIVSDLKDVKDKISLQQSEIDQKALSSLDKFKEELEEVAEVVNSGRQSIERGYNTLDASCTETIDTENVNNSINLLGEAKQNLSTASAKIQEILDKINGKSNF